MAKIKLFIVHSLSVNSLSGKVFSAGEIVEEGAFEAGRADELVAQGHLKVYTGKEAAEDGELDQVTQQEKELDKDGELTVGAVKSDPEDAKGAAEDKPAEDTKTLAQNLADAMASKPAGKNGKK